MTNSTMVMETAHGALSKTAAEPAAEPTAKTTAPSTAVARVARAARKTAGLLALGLCLSAHAAGRVEVDFEQPDHYMDAGADAHDVADTTQALGNYLRELGNRLLPAGQTLKVDILDIDLAGRTHPWNSRFPDVRVMDGRADWPRIKLRFSLEAGGQVIKRGEDSIADLDYQSIPVGFRPNDAWRYEEHLLDDWFRNHVLK